MPSDAVIDVDCPCGAKLAVPEPFTGGYVPCVCGAVYDSAGYVHNTNIILLQ